MPVVLANAYIPLAPLAPAAQVLFLVFIIVFEGWFIAKRLEKTARAEIWWKSTIGNLATAVAGVLLAILIMAFEGLFVLVGGSLKPKSSALWWIFGFLYTVAFPWAVWLLCYHISWRIEAAILNRWLPKNCRNEDLRLSVRQAHRWSYGFLGIIVLIISGFFLWGMLS